MTIEFTPYPKLARLNRDIVITEKIDGTNAAVVIVQTGELNRIEMPGRVELFEPDASRELARINLELNDNGDWETYSVFAQSRNRFVTAGADNAGFARWVQENAEQLVADLGAGVHFGEWWGSGIQRRYGLTGNDKRFSLFNVGRWADVEFVTPGLATVPVLYEGPFDQAAITSALNWLELDGSQAASFGKPEGIVIWHEAARMGFKVTLENDAAPKGGLRSEHDLLPVTA